MNEKVLKTLEYNKILNQLSEYACSPEAKKRCLALRPITDKAQIEQLQLQTKDALSRLFRCGNLSFSGVHSVNDSLKRLEIGASLSAAELLSICSLLEAAKRVKAFSRSEKEEVPDDSLTGFFTEIEPLTPGEDGCRDLVHLSGSQNEYHMSRGLLHERQDSRPDEQHDQQQHNQKLFAGRCDHHARRTLLSASQSRGKIPDSRHGT